jgi:hypothetical protein
MKRRLQILLICCLGLLASPASAGKLEDIIAAVKKECGKELTREEALRAMKSVFVICTPGELVDLDGGCRIKCLKQSDGRVLGQ